MRDLLADKAEFERLDRVCADENATEGEREAASDALDYLAERAFIETNSRAIAAEAEVERLKQKLSDAAVIPCLDCGLLHGCPHKCDVRLKLDALLSPAQEERA